MRLGAAPSTRTEGAASTAFRPDVEGLRAVAVGLVLLYHAGLGVVPGGFVGVDVFFVISGFLITGLLVKEVERSGRISLAGFYARRARRLLPAAALVLVVTALLVLALLPRTRWTDVGGDIGAAALYFVNWRLAANEVDYLAEDAGVSPVQHFWSLAVEEQFYIVWPLLLMIAALLAHRTGRGLRRTLCVGLAFIAVPSLIWSMYYTASDPTQAFFVTTTRMWELAIGAAIALGIARLARLPHLVAVVLGWAGLAAIVVSAVLLSTSTAWPGYAALLPTLGTAAVIAAGPAAGERGPIALLGRPSWTWVGGLSYSLYLWHWPLIVISTEVLGGLSQLEGLAIALLSVLPAWATLHLVENPVRFSSRLHKRTWPTLRLGAVLTVTGLLAGLGLIGATALAVDERTRPDPLTAEQDVPNAYDQGCQASQTANEPVSCVYGDPDGSHVVALAGDSKALQWISALDTIGQQRGWQIRTYTKSSCPFTPATIEFDGAEYHSCTQWGDNVEKLLRADPPDVVVTSQFRSTALTDRADGSMYSTLDTMVEALRTRWSRLVEAGSKVVVLRDNPTPPDELQPVYECVDANRDDLTRCAFDRELAEMAGGQPAQAAAARGLADVHTVDLGDAICPGSSCPAVIDGVLVYRQSSHLTRTFVEVIEPRLAKRLAPIVESD